jgi:hypothetical protein
MNEKPKTNSVPERQQEIEDLKRRLATHGENPEVRKRLAELENQK